MNTEMFINMVINLDDQGIWGKRLLVTLKKRCI